MNLISKYMYRIFHLKATEYMLFSSVLETPYRIDHMLGPKTSHSKFKKVEIISNIFSNHNSMSLEIKYRDQKTSKSKNTSTWRLNGTRKRTN